MTPGIKKGDMAKTLIVSLLIILTAVLSGCTTEDSSKENDEELAESGLLLPPEFNSTVNYNVTFNRWNLQVNYTDYGYLANYTSAYAWLIDDFDGSRYGEVFELDYDVIFEVPRDEFGNLIHLYYAKFERTNSMVFRYFTGDELANVSILDNSLYNDLKANIYETTSNPINDGLDLDYYPPMINTSFTWVNTTNTASTGEVVLKNYGQQSDVFAQVDFEYFVETIQDNKTVQKLRTAQYRLVFKMNDSDVMKVTAQFPPNVKIPPVIYLDNHDTRYPVGDPNTYSIFQQWSVRYAESGDSSQGNMTVERVKE
jgi:hypothetical protein